MNEDRSRTSRGEESHNSDSTFNETRDESLGIEFIIDEIEKTGHPSSPAGGKSSSPPLLSPTTMSNSLRQATFETIVLNDEDHENDQQERPTHRRRGSEPTRSVPQLARMVSQKTLVHINTQTKKVFTAHYLGKIAFAVLACVLYVVGQWILYRFVLNLCIPIVSKPNGGILFEVPGIGIVGNLVRWTVFQYSQWIVFSVVLPFIVTKTLYGEMFGQGSENLRRNYFILGVVYFAVIYLVVIGLVATRFNSLKTTMEAFVVVSQVLLIITPVRWTVARDLLAFIIVVFMAGFIATPYFDYLRQISLINPFLFAFAFPVALSLLETVLIRAYSMLWIFRYEDKERPCCCCGNQYFECIPNQEVRIAAIEFGPKLYESEELSFFLAGCINAFVEATRVWGFVSVSCKPLPLLLSAALSIFFTTLRRMNAYSRLIAKCRGRPPVDPPLFIPIYIGVTYQTQYIPIVCLLLVNFLPYGPSFDCRRATVSKTFDIRSRWWTVPCMIVIEVVSDIVSTSTRRFMVSNNYLSRASSLAAVKHVKLPLRFLAPCYWVFAEFVIKGFWSVFIVSQGTSEC